MSIFEAFEVEAVEIKSMIVLFIVITDECDFVEIYRFIVVLGEKRGICRKIAYSIYKS